MLSVYMRITHYGSSICVLLLKAVTAVNLQRRRSWSLTDLDIHNLRVVSELQSSNSIAKIICLRK